MSFMDSLRKAEEQGKSVARRGIDRAHQQWEDAERKIRAKMRVHPRSKNTLGVTSPTEKEKPPRFSSADPLLNEDMPEAREYAAADEERHSRQAPIVSVHGRDVDVNEIDKGAA